MKKSKFPQLKKQIEHCLKEMPITRNSDIALTIELWKKFYSKRLVLRQADQKYYVELSQLFELPREDNIKRIRAIIQNEEFRFLPTVESVAKQRKINMLKWREFIRLNRNELYGQGA